MPNPLTFTPTPLQLQVIDRVVAKVEPEYPGMFSPETVRRFVVEALPAFADSESEAYLEFVLLRFSKQSLWAYGKAEGLIVSDRPTVLFLCVHNAGRSQMALGWTKRLAGMAVNVLSGGSEPASKVNPVAVAAMEEVGVDISLEFPKPWNDHTIKAADVVITMGCGDACPLFPGRRYLDWELEDPAGQGMDTVRRIRDEIKGRVIGLLTELNVEIRA